MTHPPSPHYSDSTVSLHHGDCLDVLRSLPDASVDSVVTDPPYGLEFMGKEWDGADGGEGCWCCTDECPEDCMADHKREQ